ncbi:unnamed protein product [Cyprideis torosa]|uniref:Membrane protein insertase YidC n=1 Tax=Cyprideis torosa TaxID=163714 RepID=A0A7R8WJQ0_9CRUS|nr:unnamed protein product [Cyprideis torosa]CAG0895986.1 unnamed protein product [Cyprideis torosa]
MHPEDLRNLIVFGAISILLWMAYSHFVLQPQKEQMRAAQKIQQQESLEKQVAAGMATEEARPREEVVAEQETQGMRVKIDNDLVFGSINLTGARLDDLGLKTYYKTVEKEENSIVLYPKGTPHPKYIEQGWVSPDKNLKLPDSKTSWQLVAGDVLAPNSPVTLRWNNGQGLVFERVISLNEDYLFTTVNRVINNTQAAVILYPYSLIAQRDIPEGFMGRYVVHEGPIGYFGDELYEETYGKMDKEPLIVKTASKGWIGLTTKNWHTALIPEQGTENKFRLVYTKGASEKVKDLYQSDITGTVLTAQAGEMAEAKVNIYAGAKKLSLLNKYEKQLNVPHFDLAVDFGIFYFLTRPFFFIINFFYGYVGNFGIAIILFTIVLRICVYPLANTSFKSFANMRKIGPQMTELREKYKDDKQAMQQELVKLYQKEKVNPMAGCLPMLVQIPIFFSLFKVLSNTIEMRHAPFFGWIQDLSAPDPTSFWNLFGFAPWDWSGPSVLAIGIWPILMLITMILQRKLSPPPADKFQAQLFAMMPWMMTIILAKFAAGLVIYWTFNNLFSTIQQYIITTRMGVKVDFIGNLLGRNPEPTPIEGVHPEAALVEEEIETALGIDQEDTPENAMKKSDKKKAPEFSDEEINEARLLFAGSCDFVLGVAGLEQLPDADRNEVAFAGRSNVGKSSLINALTGRNTLARTSNTPGRTSELNFFALGSKEAGGALYLVDMPGYGYAKVSKTTREKWNRLIKNYLRGRPNLRMVFILIDGRHGLKDSDEHLMTMLDEAAVSYRIILTKCDKSKKAEIEKIEADLRASLKKHVAAYPEFLRTSALKNKGIEEFRAIITALR